MKALHNIRGARPTWADLVLRPEIADGSAAGNWPWGRTRVGPRGPMSKWSICDGSLGSEWWRTGWRTRPRCAGSAGSLATTAIDLPKGCSQISPLVIQACLAGSENKIATDNDRGNSHGVQAGMVQPLVRGRYKRCEIRPLCVGVGLADARLQRKSAEPDKAGPWPEVRCGAEQGDKPDNRGVLPQQKGG